MGERPAGVGMAAIARPAAIAIAIEIQRDDGTSRRFRSYRYRSLTVAAR
jgi:hypothetical protein